MVPYLARFPGCWPGSDGRELVFNLYCSTSVLCCVQCNTMRVVASMAPVLVVALIMVSVAHGSTVYLFRHCVRTIDTDSLAAFAAKPFPTWAGGVPLDYCLPRGMQIVEAIGRQLRGAYPSCSILFSFLGVSKSPNRTTRPRMPGAASDLRSTHTGGWAGGSVDVQCAIRLIIICHAHAHAHTRAPYCMCTDCLRRAETRPWVQGWLRAS